MTLLKWGYGALALTASICLVVSFFAQEVNPVTQITLLLQSVGYGFVCGLAIGSDM